MNAYEIIQKFVEEKCYMQQEHVLGILFYGSSKYGLNKPNSDIDLLIIYDDSKNVNSFIRGNAFIDGIRIEYFKKSIREVYISIEEDFVTQSNASVSIIGKASIIYEKDTFMTDLQRYVLAKFKNGISPITEDKAKERIATINNRIERLKQHIDSEKYSYYFEHLYNLIIEMIRRLYHEINGMPRIETYKGFRLYKSKQYQNMFSIDYIPDSKFLGMYFEIIQDKGKKSEKFEKLIEFYDYAKRSIDLDKNNHRFPIKSRYYESIPTDESVNLDCIQLNQILIPEWVLDAVKKFMTEMNYMDDEHFLGIIVYGSSLTGFNNAQSDIDLHVIFDNTYPDRLFRGKKLIISNDVQIQIEYFEKPINEEYLMAEYEFLHQDNAALSIIGRGAILYAKDSSLEKLQKFVLYKFQENLPPLSMDEAREQISIIDNKIQRLETLCIEDSPYFYHYYHIVLEKMREVHHKIIGISQVPIDKVPKIYTDAAYRKSVCKTNPSQDFVNEYLNLVVLDDDKQKMLASIKKFYAMVKHGIELGQEYKIPVESGLKHLLLYWKNGTIPPTTEELLRILDSKCDIAIDSEIKRIRKHIEE